MAAELAMAAELRAAFKKANMPVSENVEDKTVIETARKIVEETTEAATRATTEATTELTPSPEPEAENETSPIEKAANAFFSWNEKIEKKRDEQHQDL